MKAKPLLAITGLALALGGVVVWRERNLAAEAARERSRVERAAAAARAEGRRLEERLATVSRDLEARQRELAQLAHASVSPAASAAETSAAVASKRADPFEQVMRSDPKLQALRLAAERARLATDYAAFFREHGLTPEQAARFQEIACARSEAMADIDATVQSLNLAEDDPRIERARSAASEAFQVAQKALLGPDGFRRMEEFQAAISLRNSVRGLAAAALDADIPLSSGQAEQLATLLVSTGRKSPEIGWVEPNWNAVDALAPGFLTTEQLALLQHVEPSGHGSGGRFWGNLNYAISVARHADAPKPTTPSSNLPVR